MNIQFLPRGDQCAAIINNSTFLLCGKGLRLLWESCETYTFITVILLIFEPFVYTNECCFLLCHLTSLDQLLMKISVD